MLLTEVKGDASPSQAQPGRDRRADCGPRPGPSLSVSGFGAYLRIESGFRNYPRFRNSDSETIWTDSETIWTDSVTATQKLFRPIQKLFGPIQETWPIQKLRFRNYFVRFRNYDSETITPDSETISPDSETISPDSETISPDSETIWPGSETAIPKQLDRFRYYFAPYDKMNGVTEGKPGRDMRHMLKPSFSPCHKTTDKGKAR